MEKNSQGKYDLFLRIVEIIVKGLAEIGGYTAVGMTLLITANILLRIFWKPITGTYELVGLMSVIFGSFSITYLVRNP